MSRPAGANIGNMVSESIEVLTKPSVATFERFEKNGTATDAGIYVAVGAAITGVIGLLSGGFSLFLVNIITTLVGFYAFTYIVFYLGKQRGGSGSFDEVAYTFSLFWLPISIAASILTVLLVITLIGILLIPLVALLALAANVYFAYLAAQSSMNLTPANGIWTVLILALLGSWLVNIIIAAILR